MGGRDEDWVAGEWEIGVTASTSNLSNMMGYNGILVK